MCGTEKPFDDFIERLAMVYAMAALDDLEAEQAARVPLDAESTCPRGQVQPVTTQRFSGGSFGPPDSRAEARRPKK
jgi:hypothetical protein